MTTETISIENVALVARLEITGYTGERVDRSITREVNREKQVNGKYVKNLLGPHKAALKKLTTIRSNARNLTQWTTLPYHSDGQYLVPVTQCEDWLSKIGKLKDEYEQAADNFVAQLKAYGVFDDGSFPESERSLRCKFRFNVHLEPVPSNNMFDKVLGLETIADDLKASLDDSRKEMVDGFRERIFGRFIDALQGTNNDVGLVDKLREYTGEKGSKRRLKTAAIQNVIDLCDIATGLNLANDSLVTSVIDGIKRTLTQYPIQDLRDSKAKRDSVVAGLSNILLNDLNSDTSVVFDGNNVETETPEDTAERIATLADNGPVTVDDEVITDEIETPQTDDETLESFNTDDVLADIFG